MELNKGRGELDVIYDILYNLYTENQIISDRLRSINVTHLTFKKYAEFMHKKELINGFKVTDKAVNFLRLYQSLRSLVSDDVMYVRRQNCLSTVTENKNHNIYIVEEALE